jgi:hypothetical protein
LALISAERKIQSFAFHLGTGWRVNVINEISSFNKEERKYIHEKCANYI